MMVMMMMIMGINGFEEDLKSTWEGEGEPFILKTQG